MTNLERSNLTSTISDQELRAALKQNLKATDSEIQSLCNGLYEAYDYHINMHGIYHHQSTISDYNSAIIDAYGAIKKCAQALDTLPPDEKMIVNDTYQLKNGGLRASETELFDTIKNVQITLHAVTQDLKSPGSGSARQTTKEFMAGIEMLMRHFSEIYPDKALSSSPNTHFYKYVQIWFEYFFKQFDKDVQRHIKSALDHPHVRRTH